MGVFTSPAALKAAPITIPKVIKGINKIEFEEMFRAKNNECIFMPTHAGKMKHINNDDYNGLLFTTRWLGDVDKPNLKKVVFELKNGQSFQIGNGRKFKKLAKRRKNYECEELNSGKLYLFSPHVEVIPV